MPKLSSIPGAVGVAGKAVLGIGYFGAAHATRRARKLRIATKWGIIPTGFDWVKRNRDLTITQDDARRLMTTENMNQLKTQVNGLDGFNQLAANHKNTLNNLDDVKVNGIPVNEALKNNAQTKSRLKAITDDLVDEKALKKAQTEFNEQSDACNKRLVDPKANHHPAAFLLFMQQLKAEAINNIKTIHKNEIEKLKEKLENESNSTPLKQEFHLDNDGYQAFQEEMIAKLEQRQQKELSTFEEGINERIKDIHDEVAFEQDRITCLSNLRQNSASTRVEMDKLMTKAWREQQKELEAIRLAEAKKGEVAIRLVEDEENKKRPVASFRGVDLDALSSIKTPFGRKITLIKDNNGNNTFQMSLPHQWLNPFYYRNHLSAMKNDLRTLAQAIKASGNKGIKMTIDQPKDEEHAKRIAREAYEACRLEGFDHEKITLVVNGTAYSGKELTEKLGIDTNSVNALAQEQQDIREKTIEIKGREGITQLRQEIDQLRSQQKSEEQAPSPSSNASESTAHRAPS